MCFALTGRAGILPHPLVVRGGRWGWDGGRRSRRTESPSAPLTLTSIPHTRLYPSHSTLSLTPASMPHTRLYLSSHSPLSESCGGGGGRVPLCARVCVVRPRACAGARATARLGTAHSRVRARALERARGSAHPRRSWCIYTTKPKVLILQECLFMVPRGSAHPRRSRWRLTESPDCGPSLWARRGCGELRVKRPRGEAVFARRANCSPNDWHRPL